MSKIVTIIMAFTMLFSTNVFAANNTNNDENVILLSSEDSFNRTFILNGSYWGIPHEIEVNVEFTADYSYEEGSWSYFTYVDIDVLSTYIDGQYVEFDNKSYESYASAAYRNIIVNNSVEVKIGITVDNYGEVETFAYIV